MKKFLIKLINLYQRTPLKCHSYCRFNPTCSEYMKQAIDYYGSIKGVHLGIKRILRCNPFSKGGYDPVPKKINKKRKSGAKNGQFGEKSGAKNGQFGEKSGAKNGHDS